MKDKKYNIAKEEYAIGLLGYSLFQLGEKEWGINDKNGNPAGYIIYETPPYVNPYFHAHINSNGILYDNFRENNDKYFHYEFDYQGHTMVLIDLDGPKKEIEIWCNHHVYRFAWRADTFNYGFTVEENEFIDMPDGKNKCQTNEIIESIGNKVMYNGEEIKGGLDELSEMRNGSLNPVVSLLRKMDRIMCDLPFERKLEEIVGKEDIEKAHMHDIFYSLLLIRDIKRIIDRKDTGVDESINKQGRAF